MPLIFKNRNIGVLLLVLFLSIACENHVQENDFAVIEQDVNCNPNTSFATSIKPIIDNNCLPCHRTQFPVLTSFSSINRNASNIRRQVVSRRMPLNGSLSDDEIALIRCWIDNGAQNN
ncbi:c-type cytochrome [Wenyingzhuangia sp. IMCC45533]